MLYIFKPCDEDSDEAGPSNYDPNNESDNEISSDDDLELSKKNIILDTKIQEILEVFPYHGEGFIEKCLRFYSMNTERVIEALLNSEKLPLELAQIDTSLPRIPSEPEPVKPVLEYKGKKPEKHKNMNELLDDKSHIKEQKERYEQYNNGESWYNSLYNDDHDSDEYEYNVPLYEGGDILDSLPKKRINTSDDEEAKGKEMGRKGSGKFDSRSKYKNSRDKPGSSNSQVAGRVKELERNPNVQNGALSNESSESEEECQVSGSAKPKDAFCEDPAMIRARREAFYQNKHRTNKYVENVGN